MIMDQKRQDLFHELNEAKRVLQEALDDLRCGRDLGLVAFEALHAANEVRSLVRRYEGPAELSAQELDVLFVVEAFMRWGRSGTTIDQVAK